MLTRRPWGGILSSPTAVQRRSLWQCATLSSPSPTALLESVREKVVTNPASAVTVFALSKNVPQQLVSAFQRALAPSGSKTTAIGCLSEILPAAASSTSSPTKEQELFGIALAQHRPTRDTERAVPFRSALVGRPNIALGREIKPELQADHDQVDSGLEAFLKGGAWGFGDQTQAETSTQHPEIAELKTEKLVLIKPRRIYAGTSLTEQAAQSFGYPRARGLHGRPNPAVPGGSLALFRRIDCEQCLLRRFRPRSLTFPLTGRHGRYFDPFPLCGRIRVYPVLRRRDCRVRRGGSGSRRRFS